MTDDRDDPLVPGEQPLSDLGWKPSVAEKVLGLYLLWQHKPDMGSGIYAAFEALSVIGRHTEAQKGGEIEPGPNGTIQVPWWVLKVLAMGWAEYRGDRHNRSLGTVLDLERRKGNRRVTTGFRTLYRNLMLALEIVHRVESAKSLGSRKTVGKAIQEVAEDFHVGEETVRAAYKKHRTEVQRRYPFSGKKDVT